MLNHYLAVSIGDDQCPKFTTGLGLFDYQVEENNACLLNELDQFNQTDLDENMDIFDDFVKAPEFCLEADSDMTSFNDKSTQDPFTERMETLSEQSAKLAANTTSSYMSATMLQKRTPQTDSLDETQSIGSFEPSQVDSIDVSSSKLKLVPNIMIDIIDRVPLSLKSLSNIEAEHLALIKHFAKYLFNTEIAGLETGASVFAESINKAMLSVPALHRRNEERIKKVFKSVIKSMLVTFQQINGLWKISGRELVSEFITAYFNDGCTESSKIKLDLGNGQSLNRDEFVTLLTSFTKFTKKHALSLLKYQRFSADFETMLTCAFQDNFERKRWKKVCSLASKIADLNRLGKPVEGFVKRLPWSTTEIKASIDLCLNLCKEHTSTRS